MKYIKKISKKELANLLADILVQQADRKERGISGMRDSNRFVLDKKSQYADFSDCDSLGEMLQIVYAEMDRRNPDEPVVDEDTGEVTWVPKSRT